MLPELEKYGPDLERYAPKLEMWSRGWKDAPRTGNMVPNTKSMVQHWKSMAPNLKIWHQNWKCIKISIDSCWSHVGSTQKAGPCTLKRLSKKVDSAKILAQAHYKPCCKALQRLTTKGSKVRQGRTWSTIARPCRALLPLPVPVNLVVFTTP